MKSSLTIFRLFGIDLKLHFSWWFIFALLAWSLSGAYFPAVLPGKSVYIYWSISAAAALLLFLSVILHELSHALVARAKKIKVESITLFFFGGVASIPDEEMKPATELQMALAGPLFSLLFSALFYGITVWNGSAIINAVASYLAQLNLTLGIFNLLPGFPLDGGRAFRAILYQYSRDLEKATHLASLGGKIIAGLLVLIGIVAGIGKGFWLILLGAFLYFIAGVSYEQVVLRGLLSDVPISKLMRKKFPVLSPAMRVSDFLAAQAPREDAFIVQGKNFTGIVDLSLAEKKRISASASLREAALPLRSIKVLARHDTAYTAFRLGGEQALALLPVVEKKRIIGVVLRRDVLRQAAVGLKFRKKR